MAVQTDIQELITFPRPKLTREMEEMMRVPPSEYVLAHHTVFIWFLWLFCAQGDGYKPAVRWRISRGLTMQGCTVPIRYAQPLATSPDARRPGRVKRCHGD